MYVIYLSMVSFYLVSDSLNRVWVLQIRDRNTNYNIDKLDTPSFFSVCLHCYYNFINICSNSYHLRD